MDTLLALSSVPRLVDFDLLSELDKVVGADLENRLSPRMQLSFGRRLWTVRAAMQRLGNVLPR